MMEAVLRRVLSAVLGREAYVEDSVSGETTDSYADALDFDARGYKYTTIILKNTHGSNSLNYKTLVRAKYDGNDHTEPSPAQGTLAAGGTAKIVENVPVARIKVQVKSASAGNPATYQIDYIAVV